MFLSFCWSRYLTKINSISLCFSIATALLYVAISITSSKNIVATVTNKLSDKLAIYLATDQNAISTIDKLLKYYNYTLDWINDYTCIATRDNNDMLVYCHIALEDLSSATAIEVLKLARSNNINKLTIIANSYSPKCNAVLNNCRESYQILLLSTIQQWLAKAHLMPELDINDAQQSKISRYIFARASAGGYAVSALFLLATSIFSYMPIYTLVWATILVSLSLYSRFNKRHNIMQSAIMSI